MDMSWRDIPDFPGYQINRRGTVRKNTGYVLSRSGAGYSLWRAGQRQRASVSALLARAFPPDAEPPVAQAVQNMPAETVFAGKEDAFTPLPGYPGFEINRAGVARDAQGNELRLYIKEGGRYSIPCYKLNGSHRRVNGLLYEAFGPGAAGDAGWPEPALKQMAAAQKPRPKREERDTGSLRRCHDCGRPTVNYRCEACWRKKRGYGLEGAAERASGTMWDEY